ncbi:MAG: TIGR04076 family protein [Candidatus Bathyarchaeota archaeon]|nr:MAG: TIGR04076 family protein [Candidatus Bathyarchaeota archaeon]
MFKDASILMFGGNFTPWTEEGKQIVCCSDGFMSFSFKLERLDE